MDIEVIALAIGCTVFGAGVTTLIRFDRADRKKREVVRERRARRMEQRACIMSGCDRPRSADSDFCTDDAGIYLAPALVSEGAEQAPALPGSLRFGFGSGVTDLGVRFRQMRRAFAGETAILNASAVELQTVTFRPTASIFADPPRHFLSPHIDAQLAEILDNPSWANVADLSLLEELTRRQPGMPTGQYPILRTQPGTDQVSRPRPGGDTTPVPKLIGQPRVPAEVLHAIWNRQPRPQDEMPTPMPKPSPAVVR